MSKCSIIEHLDCIIQNSRIEDCTQETAQIYRQYHINGRVLFEVKCVDGKREGPFTLWYYTGDIKGVGTYVNDKQEGFYTEFYMGTGKVYKQEYFVNGEPTCVGDSYKYWHKNGQLGARYTCADEPTKPGIYQRWDENGKLEYEGDFNTWSLSTQSNESSDELMEKIIENNKKEKEQIKEEKEKREAYIAKLIKLQAEQIENP
jgi:hypothetical protein